MACDREYSDVFEMLSEKKSNLHVMILIMEYVISGVMESCHLHGKSRFSIRQYMGSKIGGKKCKVYGFHVPLCGTQAVGLIE